MTDNTETRAEAVREAKRYIESIHRNGLVPLATVSADLEAAAWRMSQGMTARGNTRPARPVITEKMVDRAARGLWVAEQDDHDWAVSVVDDVFSPPDDYSPECMESVYRARTALEAVFGEQAKETRDGH